MAALKQCVILNPSAGTASQHLDDEDVLFRQVRTLEVDSDPSIELNADGELTGCCPARFDVLPSALELVVGRSSET